MDEKSEKEKDWKTDLQPLLPYEPPPFDEISQYVESNFRVNEKLECRARSFI